MKQIIEVLKCFWYSQAPRGVFLLIIFITIFTVWLALEVSGTTSLIASSWACCRQSIKLAFIWPDDVVRLSSKVTKSSTVISPSSRSWVKRLFKFFIYWKWCWQILVQTHLFWKQLIIVSVDTSLQASCNQRIAFAMLISRIISEAFLPSPICETTYFSSFFLCLHLNPLIMPKSSGWNREDAHFGI